jgi:hypothetical protein
MKGRLSRYHQLANKQGHYITSAEIQRRIETYEQSGGPIIKPIRDLSVSEDGNGVDQLI